MKVRGHGVDEVRRVRAGRMHADLRVHLVGSGGVLSKRLLNRVNDLAGRQVECDHVALR